MYETKLFHKSLQKSLTDLCRNHKLPIKVLAISYLSNNLAIHLSVSIIFNIIKSKAFLIRSASYNLCHNHKWPIKAAKQNGVTYLKMTNYNSHE